MIFSIKFIYIKYIYIKYIYNDRVWVYRKLEYIESIRMVENIKLLYLFSIVLNKSKKWYKIECE